MRQSVALGDLNIAFERRGAGLPFVWGHGLTSSMDLEGELLNFNCWRKGFLHDSEIDKIFEKVLSGEPKLNFSGPAGGSRTTRVHLPTQRMPTRD